MTAGLLLPYAVAFVARDHARRRRFCYWNGAGRERHRAALRVAVSLPRQWYEKCQRGMLDTVS